MVSVRSGLTAILATLSALGLAEAAPLANKLRALSPFAREVLKRSAPATPRNVVYYDTGPFPSASDLQGFNVFAVTFLLSSGTAVDAALSWQELPANQRTAYLQEYNAAGISLVVSAFGNSETPTTSNADPVATANSMAAWVTQYGLQGIDVDYEDFAAFSSGGGDAESWLINYTRQLRQQLPQGEYILTHAPIAPWFSPNMWGGGGYLAVHQSVGSMIDWYNVQFYNQKAEYSTCSGLLTASSPAFPQTSLFEIIANGVAQNRLVIGKPASPSNAVSGGYMDPSTLSSCISQAGSKGWNAGVMGWQYPDASSSWITTVRGSA